MSKRRIGIFGGSFSPPHKGHFHAAEQFILAEKLDKLFIIPAYLSPGKPDYGVSAEHRLAMCKLAFASLPKAEVLDVEIRRGGTSYTVDTLRSLYREDRELIVLCGTDTALALDTWKNPNDLFRLAKFSLIPREDQNIDTLLKEKNEFYQKEYGGGVTPISASACPVSSTLVRRLIREGKGADYQQYLSPSVSDYIEKNRLYQ